MNENNNFKIEKIIFFLSASPYGKMVNLSTFLSPFSVEGVEGDKFLSQKGGEKFTHFVKKR
jgi:hypothetical protein